MGPFPADPVTMMSRVKRGASEWLGGMWWCGGNERGTSWKTGITRAVMGRGERKYYIGGGRGVGTRSIAAHIHGPSGGNIGAEGAWCV